MFAILFTNKMDGFYSIVVSFPTVIFSLLLVVSIFYWLITFLGVIDFDILDVDTADAGADGGFDGNHSVNGVAGLLMKAGLNGVPLPIIVSFIAIIGWVASYYSVYFSYKVIPSAFVFIIDIIIFLISFFLSVVLTAQAIKPLRKLFKQADQHVEKTIVGQVAIVRTGRVDRNFGEATVEDGGAGLIVKVRPYKDESFRRGDRVVLLEYIAEEGLYRVISESEFSN